MLAVGAARVPCPVRHLEHLECSLNAENSFMSVDLIFSSQPPANPLLRTSARHAHLASLWTHALVAPPHQVACKVLTFSSSVRCSALRPAAAPGRGAQRGDLDAPPHPRPTGRSRNSRPPRRSRRPRSRPRPRWRCPKSSRPRAESSRASRRSAASCSRMLRWAVGSRSRCPPARSPS